MPYIYNLLQNIITIVTHELLQYLSVAIMLSQYFCCDLLGQSRIQRRGKL